LLNKQSLPRLFGHKRIPEQRIVLPPSVIRHKVDRSPKERRRRPVHHSAFVLSDRYKLLRTRGTNGFSHSLGPPCKFFLSENHVVMNLQRIPSDVHPA